MTVDRAGAAEHQPRLFRYLRVTDTSGARRFSVPAGGTREVRLALRMTGCETLSSRAGSFVTEGAVHLPRAGAAATTYR